MEYVSDQGVNVEFYTDSVPSDYQSVAAGHPVFVEKPFVRIMIPGSQNTIIEVPVDDTHKRRFPLQWRKFEAGEKNGEMSGWKLEAWPAINSAQVKTLKYMNVFTVEQLAEISDGAAQTIGMGAMELKARAKAAVAAAKGNAAVEAQAVENKQLRDEMENLKLIVAQFTVPKDAAAEDDEPTRRKPGPKPKSEAA
jgi:hypothetical protein